MRGKRERNALVHQVAALEAARFLRMCEQDHPAAPLGRLGVFYRTGAGKTRIQSDILNDWFDDDKYRIGVVPDLKLVTNFYKQLMKDDRSLYVQAFRNYLYCWGRDDYEGAQVVEGFKTHYKLLINVLEWRGGNSDATYKAIQSKGYAMHTDRVRQILESRGLPADDLHGEPGGTIPYSKVTRLLERLLFVTMLNPDGSWQVERGRVVVKQMGRPFRMYYIKQVNEYLDANRQSTIPQKVVGSGGRLQDVRMFIDEAHNILVRDGRSGGYAHGALMRWINNVRNPSHPERAFIVFATATPGDLRTEALLPSDIRLGDPRAANYSVELLARTGAARYGP